jgi:CheY-like chemotaxis protein
MPIMDGWDFLDEYAQLNHDLDKKSTIYMVSSSNNQKDVERAKRFDEVTDYLIKPVTRDKLTLLFNEFGA